MTKGFILLKFMMLVLSFIVAAYCQTNNQLQSARVYSGFSLGMYAGWQKYTVVDHENIYTDSMFTYNVCKSKEPFGFPYYFRNGIRNRAEISYTGFLLFPYMVFVELGVKVKCFEYGELTLFKNVTLTLNGNFYGGSGEWTDNSEKWGGLVISTTHRFKTTEIEMVLQPFFSKYEENSGYESDGSEKRMESFNLTCGLVTRLDFNPENRFYFEIKTGFNWQYVYDSHYHLYRDDYSYSPTKVDRKILLHSDEILNGNNVGGNMSIAFNWLRKKRS
jgi:hypothetical protein